MEGEALRNDPWARIKLFVPGGRWRDMPERFRPYQTAKRMYCRLVELRLWIGYSARSRPNRS